MMATCLWCGESTYPTTKFDDSSGFVVKTIVMEPVVLAFGICDYCRTRIRTQSRLRTIPIRKAKNPKKYKYLNVNY